MVEDDTLKLHVIVASPPEVFDAAVIARTLFVGLGSSGWRLTVLGLGRRPPLEFITYSRVPVKLIGTSIVFGEVQETRRPVLVVDPKGKDVDSVADSVGDEATLVIDYTGSFRVKLSDYISVTALALNMLTYDAVAVIYALAVKRAYSRQLVELREDEGLLHLRERVYLAKRVAAALRLCDSVPCIDYYAIAYALRNIYVKRGVIVDLEEAVKEYGPDTFKLTLRLVKYSVKSLRRTGNLLLVVDDHALTLHDDGRLAARLYIDPYRREVCVTAGLCYTATEEASPRPVEEVPSSLFASG